MLKRTNQPTQYQLANRAVNMPSPSSESAVNARSNQGRSPQRASTKKIGNNVHTYRRWLINRPELNGINAPSTTNNPSLQRRCRSSTPPKASVVKDANRSIQLSSGSRPARMADPQPPTGGCNNSPIVSIGELGCRPHASEACAKASGSPKF